MESELNPDEVRRQMQSILESPEFAASTRMRRFLRFVLEEWLGGRSHELKESLIAIAVFDRDSGYDPRIDPIVRVEARRLRAKLATYYERACDSATLLISMPRGGYAPEVRRWAYRGRPAQILTIFVQPFACLSSDSEDAYFAEGLTREIVHALTGSPAHQVTRCPDSPYGLAIEGSVRRWQGRRRVFVNLIREPGKVYLWSDRFEDDVDEPFPFQEKVARAVSLRMMAPASE